jgi:ArsR family transcriptional regulator
MKRNDTIHRDVVDRVSKTMPREETLYDLAELFKVFGDSTRIKILCALQQQEMCVCDIAALLGMTQSAISHQLRILKQARLVKYRREGKVVYYSLDDEHVSNIFAQGFAHVSHR